MLRPRIPDSSSGTRRVASHKIQRLINLRSRSEASAGAASAVDVSGGELRIAGCSCSRNHHPLQRAWMQFWIRAAKFPSGFADRRPRTLLDGERCVEPEPALGSNSQFESERDRSPVPAAPSAERCPVEPYVPIRAGPLRAGTARAPAIPQIRRSQRTISAVAVQRDEAATDRDGSSKPQTRRNQTFSFLCALRASAVVLALLLPPRHDERRGEMQRGSFDAEDAEVLAEER